MGTRTKMTSRVIKPRFREFAPSERAFRTKIRPPRPSFHGESNPAIRVFHRVTAHHRRPTSKINPPAPDKIKGEETWLTLRRRLNVLPAGVPRYQFVTRDGLESRSPPSSTKTLRKLLQWTLSYAFRRYPSGNLTPGRTRGGRTT